MEILISNLSKLAGSGSAALETKKSIDKREKQFFNNLIQMISYVDDRSLELAGMSIDLIDYEEPYYKIIEDLVIKQYGMRAASVIFWWCSDRKLLKHKVYNMVEENGDITKISNVNQLYKFLNKLK